MKITFLKGVAWLGGLAALGLVCMIGARAQQNPSSTTTNWIGCLVVGKNDAIDAIAPGAHPTAVHQVEIGLRSDGVVIWRGAEQSK